MILVIIPGYKNKDQLEKCIQKISAKIIDIFGVTGYNPPILDLLNFMFIRGDYSLWKMLKNCCNKNWIRKISKN